MKGEQEFLAFNRGLISRLAMARKDLRRYPMAAAVQTNFMPRVLGSAMLRPGLEYQHSSRSNLAAKYIPFVFSATDTAKLEMTDSNMRVVVDDAVVTREAVSTTVTNGTFSGSLAGWTDADEVGAVSDYIGGDLMGLTGTGDSAAIRRQNVTCGSPGSLHALRVVIRRGPVTIRVGTGAGLSDYFEQELRTGTYSLAFTPTGDFWIDLLSRSTYQTQVISVAIEGAGDLTLPTPWTASELSMLRWDQSGDVVFVACNGHQQRRVERLGTTSWGICLYQPLDGPYRAQNTTPTTITPNGLSGNTSLTASVATFQPTHVGCLFTVTSTGQAVTSTFTATGETNDIRVTGVTTDRSFTIVLSSLSGTGNTVILERSFDQATWAAVSGKSWTADTTESYADGLDNQIVYYRLNCTVYAAGSTVARLSIATGSIRGVGLVTDYTSSTEVSVSVIKDFGGTTASEAWSEGLWSDYRGWPSSVALYGGRLWWAGKDRWFGSVSDDFANFDPDYEGDAAPIVRSIGAGPVDVINWLLPLDQLLAGTDGSVVQARSAAFDEVLTPSNFLPKTKITQGAARIPPAKIDDTGVFIGQGGYKALSIAPSASDAASYTVEDLALLVPEALDSGVVCMVVQRKPDTRIHCIRTDGKVAVMVLDKAEDVRCWVLVETDGAVEDAVILPGAGREDSVYYLVRRTVGGSTVRYLEKWALESECVGGLTNKVQDSFVTYTGANLAHLNGLSVVGWYDGQAYGPVTVSAGVADGIPSGATVGLYYEAQFQSTKLAFLQGAGLSARKTMTSLALVLADTHPQALQYGRDFTTMNSMPLMEAYTSVDLDAVWGEYNYEAFSVGSEWKVDERLCLKAMAPYPCTILAAVVGMNANGTT